MERHPDLEERSVKGVVELDGGDRLVGYAAKFGTRSQDLGGFVETIAPGAFSKAIGDGQDVVAYWNHNRDAILGRVSAGTVRLSQDDVGLRYEVDLPDTTAGRDVAVSVARGDIRHSSFAFRAIDDEWDTLDDGTPLRTLHAVQLYDVSPVSEPAYLDTTAALRSLEQQRPASDPEPEAQPAGTPRQLDHLRLALAAKRLPAAASQHRHTHQT